MCALVCAAAKLSWALAHVCFPPVEVFTDVAEGCGIKV
jgi:hypothetical protein